MAESPAGRRGSEVDDGRHAAPATPLLGSWIHDRYEVFEELGWGSLGHVYLARDHLRRDPLGAPQQVALKVIRRDRLTSKSIDYLKREFRALSRLDHPNVARVYDLDVVPGGGELFFSLELLRGETLVDATQRLGWDPALDLFVQALRALHYVHSRGLIHMDMKPRNVYVLPGGGSGLVKVLDFHLALEVDDAPDTTMRGTVAYMPPEVVKGEPVDHRADLYGLGAVFYEALTGSPPFADAGNVMDMLRAHAREQPPSFAAKGAQVPPALEAVVMRLLEKAPDDRFPDANAVIRALNEGLGCRFELETEETRASYIRTGRFVGRGDEMDAALVPVRELVAATRAGEAPPWQPWIYLVAGTDGVGKTRFLNELRVAVQLEGLACLTAEPARLDALNYGPFREVLSEALRRVGQAETLAELAPDGLLLDPERLVALRGRPELPLRVRTTEAMAELLREVTARAPLALVIDDLHQADERTLELVQALGSGPALPALLFLGVRSGERASQELAALPGVQQLELGQLTQTATQELLESMLGGSHVSPQLVTRLWAMTGGNPRFLEDTTRSLVETEAIDGRAGALKVTEEAAQELVPDASLQELTAKRVARLDESSLRLLGACSCSPRPRPLAFAAAVAGLSLGQAQAALAELERRGFAERQGLPGSWAGLGPAVAVEHEPLRQAALGALGEEASALHRQAARLLESRHPVASEPVGHARGAPAAGDRAEELLWHFERAGDAAHALPYACQAARAAAKGREFLHARELYAQALELLERSDEAGESAPAGTPGHHELTIRYAEVLAATGERARACELLRPLAEPIPRSAEGMRLRGAFLRDQGDFASSRQHLQTALGLAEEAQALEEDDAALEQARCLAELASVSLWTGDYADASRLGEDALSRLEALGHEEETVPVLDLLYHAARFLGREEVAGEWLERGLRAAMRHRPQEIEGARPLRPQAVGSDQGSLLGDAAGAHVPRTIVEAAFDRADRDRDLLDNYERRGKLLEAAGDRDGAAFARLNLGHLRRAAARYVEAQESYAAAQDAFELGGNRVGLALVRLSRAGVLADLRAEAEAEVEARAALAQAQSCGSRWIEAQAQSALARVAWVRGDQDALKAHLQDSQQLASALGNVPQRAALDLFRAQLALERGDVIEAATALEAFEAAPSGARSAPQRITAQILRARSDALRGPSEDDPRRLPRAEGRAGRALEEAQSRHLDEWVWRAAWCRADLRRIQGDEEGELADLTAAMDGLRRIVGLLPEETRGPYLGDPDCVALRDRFRERC